MQLNFNGVIYNVVMVKVILPEVKTLLTFGKVEVRVGDKNVTSTGEICGSFDQGNNLTLYRVTCRRPLTGSEMTLQSMREDSYFEIGEVIVFSKSSKKLLEKTT